eukprot:5842492-Pleurochrysis_carterae.AAC.3
MQKRLKQLKIDSPAGYAHFAGLNLSDFTTAALPPGVCTFFNTTNTMAEVSCTWRQRFDARPPS